MAERAEGGRLEKILLAVVTAAIVAAVPIFVKRWLDRPAETTAAAQAMVPEAAPAVAPAVAPAAAPAVVSAGARAPGAYTELGDARLVTAALDDLIRAQDAHHAAAGRYAADARALDVRVPAGVTLSVTSADVGTWSAEAWHASHAGRSCVVYQGALRLRPLTDGGRVALAARTVECDAML